MTGDGKRLKTGSNTLTYMDILKPWVVIKLYMQAGKYPM